MNRRRIVLLGDWNAEVLRDTGRYSPVWLAQQAGLRRIHAGPGLHGNIDYALTDAGCHAVHRLGNGSRDGRERGSDHDAIAYSLGDSTRRLTVLQWNLQRDRSVQLVAAQLGRLLHDVCADVAVLQECAQYVKAIRHEYGVNYLVVSGTEQENTQNVILVRRAGHSVNGVRVVQLSKHGWTTVEGYDHGPIYGPSCVIDGWLRVVGVHMPPSVNWTAGGTGLPIGPPMRVAVYVSAVRKLLRWTRHWKASE